MRKKIVQAYEQMSESYNRLIEHKPHNAYYDRPNTLNLLPDIRGKKVLDAACGPGKYAEILVNEGANVVGFDLSPKMINLAKDRNLQNAQFFIQDLGKPFHTLPDGEFDVVVCALAMHYLPDWNPTFQEFYRVLKPEGQLIISIEHPFFEYTYFRSKKYYEVENVKCVWKGFGAPVEVNSYRRPLKECLNPFCDNGFQIIKVLEPLPNQDLHKVDQELYQELMEFPAFMWIKGKKV